MPEHKEIPLFVFDAGYDPIGLGHDLADQRCAVLTRIRDDRVFYGDAPARVTSSAAQKFLEHESCCDLRVVDPLEGLRAFTVVFDEVQHLCDKILA